LRKPYNFTGFEHLEEAFPLWLGLIGRFVANHKSFIYGYLRVLKKKYM
jgi:hypothetical protein